MSSKGTWLSTLALAGLAACSGPGSVTEQIPVADDTAPWAANLPAVDDEMAPADDQVSSTSTNEPASAGASDAIQSACTVACSVPVAAPCTRESGCVAECAGAQSMAGACANLYLAFVQCVGRQARRECEVVDDDTSIVPPSGCETQLEAADDCANGAEATSETVANCTPAGGCLCADSCEMCLCALGDDASTCDVLCE